MRFEARGDRSEGRVQVALVALKLACFMESSERQRVRVFTCTSLYTATNVQPVLFVAPLTQKRKQSLRKVLRSFVGNPMSAVINNDSANI